METVQKPGGTGELSDRICNRQSPLLAFERHAARRYGRLARRLAAAWSWASVPFTTAVRTLSIRCAPRGDHRICGLAFIRRWSSHCTVLSVVAVEIGCSQRRAVA